MNMEELKQYRRHYSALLVLLPAAGMWEWCEYVANAMWLANDYINSGVEPVGLQVDELMWPNADIRAEIQHDCGDDPSRSRVEAQLDRFSSMLHSDLCELDAGK